ncbi:MAG: hypothetical protein ACOYEO_08210 [bacterium]|jgi:hypothetical protein
MPDKQVSAQQFGFGRRFGFFFIFRIAPGFFVGFLPRRLGAMSADYGYSYNDDMMIQRINEQEYMTLRRIGIPEVPVATGMGAEY